MEWITAKHQGNVKAVRIQTYSDIVELFPNVWVNKGKIYTKISEGSIGDWLIEDNNLYYLLPNDIFQRDFIIITTSGEKNES